MAHVRGLSALAFGPALPSTGPLTAISVSPLFHHRLRDAERALRDLTSRVGSKASAREVDRVLLRFIDSLDTSKAPLAVNRAAIDRAFQRELWGTGCRSGSTRVSISSEYIQ